MEERRIGPTFDRQADPFQTLVDEIDDYAILLLDEEGNILNWNQGAEKIKGYKPEEIIGKNFRNFYTKHDQATNLPERLIEKAITTGKAFDEGMRVRKNGDMFWGTTVIKALYDDDKHLKGFLKVTRAHAVSTNPHIRESRPFTPESNLEESESFMSEQYSFAIINELQKRSSDLEELKADLEKTVNERTLKLQEANDAFQASNQKLGLANAELSAMNERLAEASLLIQRQTDTIVQQQDEHLNRVLDSSNDVIWSIDLNESSKSYISRSTEQITGLSMSEMIRNPSFWMNYVHPDDRHIRQLSLDLLSERDTAECTYRILDTHGELHWMNEKMRVIKNEHNLPLRRAGLASDITSLKIAEEALAHERNLLRALIDNIPDNIYVKDKDFKSIIDNQANVQFLKSHIELEIPSAVYVGPDDDLEVLTTGRPLINKEETVRSASGQLHTLLTTKVPLKDQHGNTTGIIGISRDITERKLAERQLQKNSYVLSKANEVARIGYWLHNPHTNETAWNDQTLEIFGLPKDFKGSIQDYQGFIHPDDRENAAKAFHVSIIEKKSYDSEHRIIQPNTEVRWVHERVDFVQNESAETLDLIGVVQDITDQKTTEEVLKQFNNRHEILSKATNDAIWDWDIVNDFERWNHGIETIFGYPEGKVVSKRIWKEKIHIDDYHRVLDEVDNAFLTKESNWTSEFRYLCADRTYKYVLNRAYIIYNNEQPVRVIGAMQDITEVIQYRQGLEKMVEERTMELNDALKAEKELVLLKNQFVSIASHEFRTPLSTISLAAGFIKKYKTKLSPTAINKKLKNIEKQVSNMTCMLDDVLTIGKAEGGKLQTQLTTLKFDLIKQIAEEVLDTKGVKHKLKFSKHCLTEFFISDEKFVRNIMTNLITNAVKFSPMAKTVNLSVTSDEKNVFIKISDAGIGIPPDDMKNLYTSFHRGNNVSDIEGTGLGLSIVKKSVDLLMGTIEVKSQIGKGTEFKITLPISYA
jgi:PAS domain S-box-containing protein